MSQLQDNLNEILNQKNTYLIPSNIRTGVTILGVIGTLQVDKPDQTKTVTPTTSQQTVTPDTGYELASVTVSAVTSGIDINITPENIRNGIIILGVTGSYTGGQGGDATSDANLQAKYLLEGYSAVVDGQLIQGTMVDRGAVTITATSSDVSIPEGHYDSLSIPVINAANCADYTECSNAINSI